MRGSNFLPVVLGIALLNGCGGGGSSVGSSNKLATLPRLHYSITDLGAVPITSGKATSSGLTVTQASALTGVDGVAINNVGQVVTTARVDLGSPSPAQAVLYEATSRRPDWSSLGTLGGSASSGYGINNSGQVVGDALLSGNTADHAFLYAGGGLIDLGTLGGNRSTAYAINNVGQIVGVADTQFYVIGQDFPISVQNPGSPHMFLYQNGKMNDMGTISGYNVIPYAINDQGVAVGQALPAPSVTLNPQGTITTLAFTTSNGALSPLPSLGGTSSSAHAINNSGLIVGQSSTPGTNYQLHAVKWQGGQIADLGTLPNGNHSIALGVNSQGDIVGGATAEANSAYDMGFILPHNGTMANLNSLVPANSGWTLLSAYSINDSGQIVGTGIINQTRHIYLLTPAP